MRIEYWARVREKNGSCYITIPKGECYKLSKEVGGLGIIVGKEVKVEVSL